MKKHLLPRLLFATLIFIATQFSAAAGGGFAVFLTVQNVPCFGDSTGCVYGQAIGGTSPYHYLWSTGDTTPNVLCGVPAGIYCVTVTDAASATVTGCDTVRQHGIIQAPPTIIHNLCHGECNASISVNISGGYPPYAYVWNNGDTALFHQNLCAGHDTLYITDSMGCHRTRVYVVDDPPQLRDSAVIQNVLCFGAITGFIDIFGMGGRPPYTFAWSNGATVPSINNLAAGTYTIMLTDSNGCMKLDTFFINEPPLLTLGSPVITNVSTHGGNDGSISVAVTGGTPPITSVLINLCTDSVALNWNALTACCYALIVTDGNGCAVTDTLCITEPSGIHDLNENLNVRISPQPAKDEVQIILGQQPQHPLELSISNVLGQIILKNELKLANTTINISSLPKGEYLLLFRSAEAVTVRKMLVK